MNFGATIRLNKFGTLILVCLTLVFALHIVSKNWHTSSDDEMINLRTLLSVAIKAAEKGGKKVVEVKEKIIVKSKGLTKEGMPETITTADVLSHCDIEDTIEHFFPAVKLISEETVKNCDELYKDYTLQEFIDKDVNVYVNQKDVTIWIDPLDATYEYAEKLYQFVTTMVCVAVKGKPVIGVIHKPFEKTTSWAWVDTAKSEDLSNQESRVENGNLKVIVSRTHKGDVEEILKKNLKPNVEIIVAAGAGYKALEVAKNKVDAYIHVTAIKKWDICAGNAVINALNGKMVDKFGAELNYSNDIDVKNENGLIASLTEYKKFIGKLDKK